MDCKNRRFGKFTFVLMLKRQGLSRSVESTYYKSEGKEIPIKWSAPVLFLLKVSDFVPGSLFARKKLLKK
jgi:hypothetical protein